MPRCHCTEHAVFRTQQLYSDFKANKRGTCSALSCPRSTGPWCPPSRKQRGKGGASAPFRFKDTTIVVPVRRSGGTGEVHGSFGGKERRLRMTTPENSLTTLVLASCVCDAHPPANGAGRVGQPRHFASITRTIVVPMRLSGGTGELHRSFGPQKRGPQDDNAGGVGTGLTSFSDCAVQGFGVRRCQASLYFSNSAAPRRAPRG